MQDKPAAAIATLASLLHAEPTRPESLVSPQIDALKILLHCSPSPPPHPLRPVCAPGFSCFHPGLPVRHQENLRKVDIAAHVFATWTDCGTRAAHLADRFLDGSIEQLEQFLRASPTERLPVPEQHHTRFGTADSSAADAQGGAESASCRGRCPTGKVVQAACPAERTVDDQQTDGVYVQCYPCASIDATQHAQHAQQIDVRDAAALSYDEFVWRYMAPNVPVVIRVRSTDVCSSILTRIIPPQWRVTVSCTFESTLAGHVIQCPISERRCKMQC